MSKAKHTRPSRRRDIAAGACATTAPPVSVSENSLLLRRQAAQHVRCDQDDALLRHMKTLPVLFPIHTDLHAAGNLTVLIDDGPFDDTVGSNLDVREDDGAVDAGAFIYPNIREQERRTDDCA